MHVLQIKNTLEIKKQCVIQCQQYVLLIKKAHHSFIRQPPTWVKKDS